MVILRPPILGTFILTLHQLIDTSILGGAVLSAWWPAWNIYGITHKKVGYNLYSPI